jgi:hypothetical protein
MGVHLAAKHALEFELADLALEPGGLALDVACRGLIVLALGQRQQCIRIAERVGGPIQLGQFGGEPRPLAPELLGALRGAPDGRVLEL